MPPDRRSFLIRSALGLAAAAAGTSCAGLDTAAPTRKVALLVPTSGQYAALGADMMAAAQAGLSSNAGLGLEVFDSGSDAQTAQRAARDACSRRAVIVLGPLFGPQVDPVLSAIGGGIPIMTFSNDESLARAGEISEPVAMEETVVGKAPLGTHTRRLRSNREPSVVTAAPADAGQSDVWVLGVTARQSAQAIIRYARRQGARRLAVVGNLTQWSLAAKRAAKAIELNFDVEIRLVSAGADGLDAASLLAPTEGRDAPHAVLFADRSAGSIVLAAEIRRQNFPVLFAVPDGGPPADAISELEGAWFVSPKDGVDGLPAGARRAIARATNPLLARLAYDAASVVPAAIAGPGNLIRSAAFNGALGGFEFREDRLLDREMTILSLTNGQLGPVARVPGGV